MGVMDVSTNMLPPAALVLFWGRTSGQNASSLQRCLGAQPEDHLLSLSNLSEGARESTEGSPKGLQK